MNVPIDITGVEIKAEHLLLRPWRLTDLSDFYEYARVDGVGQMAGWLPHKSIEESQKVLQMFVDEKRIFALEHHGKVIGSLGIETYEESRYKELALDELRGREIGYVLSKDYWGQGLMPEAVQAVVHYLFDEVKLDFIIVGHFTRNDRSRRVIEKCGFTYVKTIPYKTQEGRTEDSMEYILYNQSV